jgi:hypothetical protein
MCVEKGVAGPHSFPSSWIANVAEECRDMMTWSFPEFDFARFVESSVLFWRRGTKMHLASRKNYSN